MGRSRDLAWVMTCFGERMAEAVEVRLAGAARQFVEAEGDALAVGEGLADEFEGRIAVEAGVAVQFVAGELDEQALKAVEEGIARLRRGP